MTRLAVLAMTAAALLGSSSLIALGADEKVRTASTGAPAADECTFNSQKDMIAIMAADLDSLSKSRAKGTRYLSLTHLASICTKDKLMAVYRQGAIKLVNSLSRSSEVVVLETIDPAKSILRINIDDLGWDAADWETLVASYPYGQRPDTQLNTVVDGRTGTKVPFIRADWFAFVAARPGMYEKLLKLPKTFRSLPSSKASTSRRISNASWRSA